MQINTNYANLQDSYLFLTIAKKVAAYTQAHPENRIIRMGIGDVTQPLVPAVIEAMHKATDEMAHKETFHGYSPDQGYDFLREAIQGYYAKRGVSLKLSEIFVGDGAKSDIGNIVDIFGEDNRVLIPDPVYPVYVDTNVMSGRKVAYLDANERNGFLGMPDENTEADIIYLCSPNNPTGAVYSRAQLEAWVDYALRHEAVILFDAAYESFIADDTLPHSIFEIEGAKKCAIEFCSFSKTAGFTGVRCGYTVIADELVCGETQLNRLWARRQATKFNGVNYITQRAAAAVFTEAGQKQVREVIDYYRRNAALMVDAFKAMGLWFTGGENSPYIWHKVPVGMTSWEFFDDLLARAEVVGTPAAASARNGEGVFRPDGVRHARRHGRGGRGGALKKLFK